MADRDVIPGIIPKQWEDLTNHIASAASFVHWMHVYVSDGTIGAEETVTDFSKFSDLTQRYPDISFEAHILAANPEKYLRQLTDAGFRRLIVHVESNDPRRFFEDAKYDDVEVGIALDGATEIDQVEPFLEEVDFVVVMTAEAGKADGTFLPEAVEKIKLIHQNFPDLPIEVAGGINDITVRAVGEAGATRIVSSNFIFKNPHTVGEAIEALRTA